MRGDLHINYKVHNAKCKNRTTHHTNLATKQLKLRVHPPYHRTILISCANHLFLPLPQFYSDLLIILCLYCFIYVC